MVKRLIKNFSSFNEGIVSGLSDNIKSVLKSIKPRFSKEISDLKKFDISYKKISDTNYQFLHNNRIIAELKIDGEEYNKPIFKLIVFYYNSEIRNDNNLQLNQKFKNQKEQPYAKGSKRFYSSDSAIDTLVGFWSTKTNSGKSKNSDFKIKL